MPDFSGSQRRSDQWVTEGTPKDVQTALTKGGQSLGGRVESHDEDGLVLAFGSRFGLRMLGMFTPARMIPLSLRISIASDPIHNVRITLDAVSDEGWYVVELKALARRVYDKAFDRIFTSLRESALPS